MDLFDQAVAVLKTGAFNRERCLKAAALYGRATGEERRRIGQLFESQMVLAKTQEDAEWLLRTMRA